MVPLYRKSSLEKLSSPEQLDKMVVVVPMSVWIAIIAGVVLTVTVVLWGILGTVPVTKTYHGAYSDMGSVMGVYTNTQGEIIQCDYRVGDEISQGDVIAVVRDAQGQEKSILSEYNGMICDLVCFKGKYVALGEEVAQIRCENEESQGYVFCYVPVMEAGLLEEGMQVMIDPDYLSQTEYGHIAGEIEDISKFVLTKDQLKQQLGNEDFVDILSQKEALVGVKCKLQQDSTSASGYKWSNEKGKDVLLKHGTPVQVEVILDQKSPADLLL